MPMTVAEGLDTIMAALGMRSLDARLSGVGILNDAGQLLVNSHSWQWLHRPRVDLPFVTDQSTLELPTDFDELISAEHKEALVNAFNIVDPATGMALRTSQIDVTSYQYYAWVTYQNNDDGVPTPRLELWPTPATTTDEGAISIEYRAGWTRLGTTALEHADQTVIPIPEWLIPLFRRILRATAKGWEEEDEAAIEVRYQSIVGSQLFLDAQDRDGRVVATVGELDGGAAQSIPLVRNYDYPVADPTSS